MKKLFIVIIVTLLGGCSITSAIQKASLSKSEFDDATFDGETSIVNDEISDKDAYRIFHQAASGFVSIQSIRSSAEKRANKFCEKKDKIMQTLRERTSTPPHILGNFPRIEIIFACTESAKLSSSKKIDKYEQLRKLKSLLDDGAITSKEFKTEKTKLLSK